jgi:EmrB/QacA subfamily drug resistance transporter
MMVADQHQRSRYVILATCCVSLVVVGIDITAVNLALPAVKSDLHASVSDLQWVLNAYTLVLAALLMAAGGIGDRFGRKRVFLAGLVLFGLGSIVCALAPVPATLIVGRAIQAVGGSVINPLALSIVRVTFTDDAERARAIGLWGTTFPISMACGPIIGGALVSGFGWRSIFWINVPIVLLAALAVVVLIPSTRQPDRAPIDPLGQLLLAAFLGSVTFLIINGPHSSQLGFSIGAGTIAVLSVAGYWFHDKSADHPVLDLSLMRFAAFRSSAAITLFGYAGFSVFLFFNSIYFQSLRELTPLQTGFISLPFAVANAAAGVLVGRMVPARGARMPLLLSGLLIVIGSAMLIGISTQTPLWLICVSYLCVGAGIGGIGPPITNTILNALPPARSGVAAGLISSIRQTGQALSIAALGGASISWWWLVAVAGVLVVVFARTAEPATRDDG